MVYHDLSSKNRRKKVYRDGVLKVDVTRFSKYGLQFQVQGRRFEWATERLGSRKTVYVSFQLLFAHVR